MPLAPLVSAAQARRAPSSPGTPSHSRTFASPGCALAVGFATASRAATAPSVTVVTRSSPGCGGGAAAVQRKSQSTPWTPTQAGSRAAVPRGSVTRWRGGSSGTSSPSRRATASGSPSAER